MIQRIIAEENEKRIHVNATFYSRMTFDKNYKSTLIHWIYFKKTWIEIIKVQRIYKVNEGDNIIYHFIVYNKKDTMFHLIYNPLQHYWEIVSYEYED